MRATYPDSGHRLDCSGVTQIDDAGTEVFEFPARAFTCRGRVMLDLRSISCALLDGLRNGRSKLLFGA